MADDIATSNKEDALDLIIENRLYFEIDAEQHDNNDNRKTKTDEK